MTLKLGDQGVDVLLQGDSLDNLGTLRCRCDPLNEHIWRKLHPLKVGELSPNSLNGLPGCVSLQRLCKVVSVQSSAAWFERRENLGQTAWAADAFELAVGLQASGQSNQAGWISSRRR